jgi:hypothetical protein
MIYPQNFVSLREPSAILENFVLGHGVIYSYERSPDGSRSSHSLFGYDSLEIWERSRKFDNSDVS